MPDIQDPRVADDLRQEFRVTTPFGVSLSEVIQPVALVRDLTERVVSTAFPRRARGTVAVGAGGVGTNAVATFSGRVGEGMLFHLIGLRALSNAGSGQMDIRFSNGAVLATAGSESLTKGYTDQRVSTPLPRAFLSGQTPLTAALEGTIVESFTTVSDGSDGETYSLPMNAVVAEADFIMVAIAATNQSMIISFDWIEYLLADR